MPCRSDQQMQRNALPSKALLSPFGSHANASRRTPYFVTLRHRSQQRLLKHELLRHFNHKPFNGKQLRRHVTVMTLITALTEHPQQISPQVVIITTVGCPFCQTAKQALQQERVDYEEIEASSQLELLSQMKAVTGRRTVPQVVMNVTFPELSHLLPT